MSQPRSLQPHEAPGLGVASTPAAAASLQPPDQKHFILPGDVQQLLVKEEVLQIASLGQPFPEPVQIKEEEQEQVWAGQDGEQEEMGVGGFSLTKVTVKSEDDEEIPQFSQLHQHKMEDVTETKPPTYSSDEHMKTETGFKDSVGLEPGWNSDPNHELQQIKGENEENPQFLKLHEIKKEENMEAELPSTTLFDYKIAEGPEPGWNPDLNGDSQQKADENEVTPQSPQLYEIKIEDVTEMGPPTFYTAEGIQTGTSIMNSVRPEPGRNPDPNGDLHQISDEKCQPSQLYEIEIEDVIEMKPPTVCTAEHIKPETGFKDSVGPEPSWNPDPNSYLQQMSDGNEGKPNSLQIQEIKQKENSDAELPTTSTADCEDSLRPEPTRNPVPKNKSQLNLAENTSDSSEAAVRGQNSSESEPAAEQSENTPQEKHGSELDVTRHGGCTKSFKCPVCDEEFPRMQALRLHMRSHAFPCGVCWVRFKKLITLEKHMLLHTGEKPFECEQCGERFILEQSLTLHVKAHSGLVPDPTEFVEEPPKKKRGRWGFTADGKKITCEECGECFRSKTDLQVHAISHMAKKPPACDKCSQIFNSHADLQLHLKSHKGKQPFACGNCEKCQLMRQKAKALFGERTPHGCEGSECGRTKQVAYDIVVKNVIVSETEEATNIMLVV
ncbi:zinc finger protein 768-like [Cololabis saira]|uniref:zinc finger protein 768-like n=1 Tax=Cololabis saira TaxID=129043 RepID=UPI002AD266C7|nr:zinc finger protein 768-like [Cololabis saira]